MKKKGNHKDSKETPPENIKPGDQFAYPADEDIYNNANELEDVDVDDLTRKKTPNVPADEMNEKDFNEDVSGDDLDVPGSEDDDENEEVGSEDEENNSYSIGGEKKD